MSFAKTMLEMIARDLKRLRDEVAKDADTAAGVDLALAHLQAARLSWAKRGPDEDDDPTPLEVSDDAA